jgi:CheY-like chemotaxis protein
MSNSEAGEPRKILIVDDEPNIVTYLEMLLQDEGFTTVSAANGKEGFEVARQERPDLVCLDITMPEESGIRCYRNIKSEPDLADTPVLIVTAVTGFGGDPEPFRQFMSSRKQIPEPEGFFSKPIDRDAFLEKVRELLPV